MSADASAFSQRPSRVVSIAVTGALVAIWAAIRLVVFDTTLFPLTFVLPLLVCVWTRSRVALWIMAATFLALHVVKLFWMMPADTLSPAEFWGSLVATTLNVLIAAVVIHGIIRLRERLQDALVQVSEQAEALRAQSDDLAQRNEELSQQAEELSHQTEELAQQGEELAAQNEELQSQSEDIHALNATLERREALLQALLETARVSGAEHTALQHIAAAGRDLFGASGVRVTVFEATPDGLRVLAQAGDPALDRTIVKDDFAVMVIAQDKVAGLNATSLRPDIELAINPAAARPRSALGAPIHMDTVAQGAFVVYRPGDHDWTHEEFQLAEWLASQCGRVIQTLRVQSELRDADRRKSEFLATLSHELRNPLAPIRFALKLIENGTPDANAVRILQRQVRQLVRLVDDLLDATRLSSNKVQIRPTRIDFLSVVQQAIEACRPDIDEARHELVTRLPDHPVWLDADAERMAQVVTNLLNNAIRYTPRSGRLTVSLTVSGRQAVCSVKDTGVGLDRADLERVFDMFAQVDGPGSGGLGIGLALVRGIVELHGGHVEARSEGHGRGTEFTITMPLAAAQTAAEPPQRARATPAGGPCRVLVVDDNADSAEMMGALLGLHGHDVRIAHSAESAIATAVDFHPHAALLDIGLPDVDGYELARRLRNDKRTGHVRLIAVTGWGQPADRERAHAAGFDAHLTKPAEPDMILAALGTTESA